MKKYQLNKEYTTNLEAVTETILKEPSLFQVFIHNDDYTPMEFVMAILEKFFYLDRRQAADIMLAAHMEGSALCGVYTKDVAETKIAQTIDYARMHEHPLTLTAIEC
jgi:ATP-dependent Clp protease adaptor protein ClpS